MNSVELAYQLRKLSTASLSSCDSSVPSSEMMSASMMSDDFDGPAHQFELDCSGFNGFSPTSSCATSFNSLLSAHHAMDQGFKGGLSKSRCAHNLSALCDSSSISSMPLTRQTQSYESAPHAGWGYYVDTPSR